MVKPKALLEFWTQKWQRQKKRCGKILTKIPNSGTLLVMMAILKFYAVEYIIKISKDQTLNAFDCYPWNVHRYVSKFKWYNILSGWSQSFNDLGHCFSLEIISCIIFAITCVILSEAICNFTIHSPQVYRSILYTKIIWFLHINFWFCAPT